MIVLHKILLSYDQLNPTPIFSIHRMFDHLLYFADSDGNGWWQQDMVGLEATACVEWEGIGSMSLGDPFMSPL